MGVDTFPPWVTRIRKDPLGSTGFNRLLERYQWAEALFGREHLLSVPALGGAGTGDHNAAEIPREVGSIFITAGPTGNAEGFRHAIGATRSAAGTIQLALDNSVYSAIDQMALQVQNCSEAGINKPSITSAKIISTGSIEFYSKTLTSALGGGNAWGNDDAHFCVAINAHPLPGGLREGADAKTRGDWLTDDVADLNVQIQADADLRAKFLSDLVGSSHTTAGVHVCREVARTWADIKWDGAAYRIRDTSTRNPCATVTRPGIGHAQLTFSTAWALSAQPFIATNYAASAGGAVTDIFANSTPRSLITTTTVDVYLYQYAAGVWARADTDFFTVIHGG